MGSSRNPGASAGRRPVYEVLGSHAALERSCLLGDGLRLAQWHNDRDAPRYCAPGHHTISVYLEGGFSTYLAQHPEHRGAPGKVCLMPAEGEYSWVVDGPLRFIHLYVSTCAWAERIVRLLDAEPRCITLAEDIYADNPALVRWATALARSGWDTPDDHLAMDAACHETLDALVIAAAGLRPRSTPPSRGGLAAHVRRRTVEWVDAHLQDDFTLTDLAGQAALSEYHFARMFRTSMGVTPHVWVASCRLARAREMILAASLPLEQIASACGFAHASHLTRRFRETYGLSPARFRKLYQPRRIIL